MNQFGIISDATRGAPSSPTRSQDHDHPRLSLFGSSPAASHVNIKSRDPITAALTQMYSDVVHEDLPEEMALMIEDIDRAIAVSERVK